MRTLRRLPMKVGEKALTTIDNALTMLLLARCEGSGWFQCSQGYLGLVRGQ